MQIFGKRKPKSLDWYVAVYVPATTDVDRKIDNTIYVKQALRVLSQLFGGATAVQTRGAWVADDKRLIIERTVLVYAYCQTVTGRDRRAISRYATYLKGALKQESVAYEIRKQSGGLTFV